MAGHGKGWRHSLPDHRDRIFNAEERVYKASQLPGKFDLWPNVPPIWDQGQLGSCTAHGSLRALMSEALRQGVAFPMLSRLMQYYDSRALEGTTSSDAGAEVRDAIKALVKNGCCPEDEWPYEIAQFADKPPDQCYQDARQYMSVKYQRVLPHGPGAPIRSAIAAGLPVVIGFNVPAYFEQESWNPATTPLPLPGPNDNYIGGHCVALTGYDFTSHDHPRPYFIADNSWSTNWGGTWGGQGCNGGRFAMDYRWFNGQLASDFWVISAVT